MMAKTPPNQSGTQTGSIPTKKTSKPKPKPKAATKPKGHDYGDYDWGDGKGKVHSKPLADHQQAVQAKTYGIDLNAPVATPLTTQQAYGFANAAADRAYGPQLAANQQLQVNTPQWYENYKTQSQAQQAAAQAYAQPLLNNAQAGVTNAAAATPGLDPNSAQYATDQQAAQGRAALAQLGYDTLAVVPAATNAGFAGQQAIASRELPQVLAGLGTQYGQLQAQRGQAVTDEYGKLRTQEQNYGIAQSTLNLNSANTLADNTREDAKVTQAAADKKTAAAAKGNEPNKYGIPAAQWAKWSSSHRQRVIDAAKKSGSSDQGAKDAAKKTAAIQKSTGSVKNEVTNLISKWNSYVGKDTDDTSKPILDPATKKPTGQYESRKITPSDIKAILGQKSDAGLIHVMLLVKVGKPLDKAAIDYLHQKDPNIRIPREWLSGKVVSGDRYGAVGKGADTTEQPASSGGSSGSSKSSGLTKAGKAPTVTQVLANPQAYTPAQVKTARKVKAQGGSPGITIDKSGGVG